MKKWRILVCLLLVFPLVCCGGRETDFSMLETPVEGIRWGMTPEEVTEELEKAGKTVTIVKTQRLPNVIQMECPEAEVYGQKASLRMNFYVPFSNGLDSIFCTFSEWDLEQVEAGLTQMYGEPQYRDGAPFCWESQTIGELDRDFQKLFERNALFEQDEAFSEEERWEQIEKRPLVKIELIDRGQLKALDCQGGYAAQMFSMMPDS